MFMSKKKYNEIITEKNQKIEKLQKELDEARDLQTILNKLSGITVGGIAFNECGGNFRNEFTLPDTILQYTDDILGGKVIKQEGNKAIVISKEGEVKTGLTKQKPDKGFSYKLVRE